MAIERAGDVTMEDLIFVQVACVNDACENYGIIVTCPILAGGSVICGPCKTPLVMSTPTSEAAEEAKAGIEL